MLPWVSILRFDPILYIVVEIFVERSEVTVLPSSCSFSIVSVSA